MVQFIRSKLEMDVGEMDTSRAPLASEETMEESPVQLCDHISEFTRGKEFKVISCAAFSKQTLCVHKQTKSLLNIKHQTQRQT